MKLKSVISQGLLQISSTLSVQPLGSTQYNLGTTCIYACSINFINNVHENTALHQTRKWKSVYCEKIKIFLLHWIQASNIKEYTFLHIFHYLMLWNSVFCKYKVDYLTYEQHVTAQQWTRITDRFHNINMWFCLHNHFKEKSNMKNI